jgi:hypothetical protein
MSTIKLYRSLQVIFKDHTKKKKYVVNGNRQNLVLKGNIQICFSNEYSFGYILKKKSTRKL